jgi:hypothetical protein
MFNWEKETTSDVKFKVCAEVWKDKDGKIRESHRIDYDNKGVPKQELWDFKGGEQTTTFLLSSSVFGELFKEPIHLDATHTKKDSYAYIEEVEKQFAKDGTIPPNPFKEKEKEVPTTVEKPTLPGNEVFTNQRLIRVWSERGNA